MTAVRAALFFLWFYGLSIPLTIAYCLLLPTADQGLHIAVDQSSHHVTGVTKHVAFWGIRLSLLLRPL